MYYNPNTHHRRSIRLKGYDYSQSGLYFITICTYNRECIFGTIMDGTMILNDAGTIANEYWLQIPQHFPNVVLHEHIIMPNHVHGIIELMDNVIIHPAPPGISPDVGAENILPLPPYTISDSSVHRDISSPDKILDLSVPPGISPDVGAENILPLPPDTVSDLLVHRDISSPDKILDLSVPPGISPDVGAENILPLPPDTVLDSSCHRDISSPDTILDLSVHPGISPDVGAENILPLPPDTILDSSCHRDISSPDTVLDTLVHRDISPIDVGAENILPLLPLRTKQNTFQKMIPRSIGSIVKGYKIGVTKWFRNVRAEDFPPQRPIWQRNYYEHIIRNEKAYWAIAEYIVMNPSKWKDDTLYKA